LKKTCNRMVACLFSFVRIYGNDWISLLFKAFSFTIKLDI